MITPGVYEFKTEFWKLTGITKHQWENRREDLLEWLKNFYDYELLEGRPLRIVIKEVEGEYRPLPRKVQDLTEEKKNRYTNFTISSLGSEFKPNSKAKTTREALSAFGKKDYGHENIQSISKRYVGPAFDRYGETNNIKHWVWYSTYEPLDDKTLVHWRNIMREEHISEEEAANAFYCQESGEDISRAKGYFKMARDRLKMEYGDSAILVADWRLKREE